MYLKTNSLWVFFFLKSLLTLDISLIKSFPVLLVKIMSRCCLNFFHCHSGWISPTPITHISSVHFFQCLFILRERERERELEAGSMLPAQSPQWGSIHQVMTWAEIKLVASPTEPLRHPCSVHVYFFFVNGRSRSFASLWNSAACPFPTDFQELFIPQEEKFSRHICYKWCPSAFAFYFLFCFLKYRFFKW